MGVGGAEECGVKRVRRGDVIDKVAGAPQKTIVFHTGDARTEKPWIQEKTGTHIIAC